MKTVNDCVGNSIRTVVQCPKGQAIITEEGNVLLCRDLRVATAMEHIEALRRANGYRNPGKTTPKKKDTAPDREAAPFIPTTVAEDERNEPAEPQFDMGPHRPWLDKVEGLAKPTDDDKVEGWD